MAMSKVLLNYRAWTLIADGSTVATVQIQQEKLPTVVLHVATSTPDNDTVKYGFYLNNKENYMTFALSSSEKLYGRTVIESNSVVVNKIAAP